MAQERKKVFPNGTTAVLHERGLHPAQGMGYIVRNEVRPATPEELAELSPHPEAAEHLGSLVARSEVEHVAIPDMPPSGVTPDTTA